MRKLAFYCLLAAIGCLLTVRFVTAGSFETAPEVAWSQPTDLALNNLGPADPSERSYDCTELTFRMIDDISKTMRPGCFVPTAAGMIDPDQSIIIFNNTDEGQLIKQGGQPAGLSVLPHAGAVGRFGGFPGAGAYMYLYTDFFSALGDGGNPLVGRYKTLDQAPNFVVSGSDGQPIAVNPSALAYSARSQWLVTETPGHSLVRINLATFSVLPFAKSFDIPGRPFANHNASLTVTEDGRYVAVASNEFRTFTVYDLKHCGVVGSDPLAPLNCASHDYWPFVERQASGELTGLSHVEFVKDDLLSFTATVGSRSESYLLKPDGIITSLIPYLGLGDSYASGQGAFDYRVGTDTAANRCHLSGRSYPLLLNQDLFGGQGQSVACSGARAHDVGSKSQDYTGQSSEQLTARAREADGSEVDIIHDFKPGYLAQQRFVTAYQPGVITLQIGGNDAGFGAMILRCLSPLAKLEPPVSNPNNCYASYEDRSELIDEIGGQFKTWTQLYRQLKKASPSSRVYAIGYPQIVSPTADCRTNVHLTLTEIMFAREVTLYINSVLAQAAKAAGVQYVDIAEALQDHELCSGASGKLAVNGLTAGTDLYFLGQESFHPTAYGHELIEQAIMRQTHNFSGAIKPIADASAQPPVIKDTDPLLKAPKTGRAKTTTKSRDITAPRVVRGQTSNVKLAGLKPNTVYKVTIGGAAAGSLTSDDHGAIGGAITVPTNVPPGVQIITVTGPGQGSQPETTTQPIYVPVSPTDSDGDGVPDTTDSCPLVVNSGYDVNQNGVDDACDNEPPVAPPVPVVPNVPAEPTSPPAMPPATTLPVTPNNPVQSTLPIPEIVVLPTPTAVSPDFGAFSNQLDSLQPAGRAVGISLASSVVVAKPISGRSTTAAAMATKQRLSAAKPALPRLAALTPNGHDKQLKLHYLAVFHWLIWLIVLAICYCVWLLTRSRQQRRAIGRERLQS